MWGLLWMVRSIVAGGCDGMGRSRYVGDMSGSDHGKLLNRTTGQILTNGWSDAYSIWLIYIFLLDRVVIVADEALE
jgi:hypothetical protein